MCGMLHRRSDATGLIAAGVARSVACSWVSRGFECESGLDLGFARSAIQSCHICFQRYASRPYMSAQDKVDLCRPVAVSGTHWPGYRGMHRIQLTSSTVCVSPNPRGDSAKRDMLMSRGLSVHSDNGEAGVQEGTSAECEDERGICFVHKTSTHFFQRVCWSSSSTSPSPSNDEHTQHHGAHLPYSDPFANDSE